MEPAPPPRDIPTFRQPGRVLLIVNTTSGTGHGHAVVEELSAVLDGSFGTRVETRVEVVEDHLAARALAGGFLAASEEPALVITGGGNGTLRAAIEGLCEANGSDGLPGRDRVVVGALRMGSGNPLARQLGAPSDPVAGLRGVIENLVTGRIARCCILRCEAGTPDGGSEVFHATTMAGFGQFGRVPGDLERWHRRVSGPRAVAARLLGVERLNNAEYVLALLLRAARCALSGPTIAEKVEVDAGGRREHLPLLAGVAMSFPLAELPVDPGTRVEDEAFSLYLAPFAGRKSALSLAFAPRRLFENALHVRLEGDERVEIRPLGRDPAEFFLDEDPAIFHGWLTLRVAGSMAFVPGPGYPKQREVSA